MRIKFLSVLFFTAAMSVPLAYAGQDYTVTLTNGNTLTTSSYRLEGRKFYLRYPVGEVAIPASEVASVTTGDGSVQLLQIKGELKPGPAGSKDAAPVQAALPGTPFQGPGASQLEAGAPGNPAPGGSDGSTDSRDKGSAVISGGVSGAVPSDGGVNGVLDTNPDNNPADDAQAAEIRKRLDNNLDDPGEMAEPTDGAVDSTVPAP